MMVIITGDTRGRLVEFLRENGWGRMFVGRSFKVYEGEQWGFDNGAYRDWLHGKTFDEERYKRALDKAISMADKQAPYLSVLPDIVAGGERSLELSDKWADRLKTEYKEFALFNWYLAVQDGFTLEMIEEFIRKHKIKGIFLGGSDRFKATAPVWSKFAKEHNLRFHYARAGTPKKYALAKLVAADSLDSTFFLWTKTRISDFIAKGERIYRMMLAQSRIIWEDEDESVFVSLL